MKKIYIIPSIRAVSSLSSVKPLCASGDAQGNIGDPTNTPGTDDRSGQSITPATGDGLSKNRFYGGDNETW